VDLIDVQFSTSCCESSLCYSFVDHISFLFFLKYFLHLHYYDIFATIYCCISVISDDEYEIISSLLFSFH